MLHSYIESVFDHTIRQLLSGQMLWNLGPVLSNIKPGFFKNIRRLAIQLSATTVKKCANLQHLRTMH